MGIDVVSVQQEFKESYTAQVEITNSEDNVIALLEVEYVVTYDPDFFDTMSEEINAWRLDKLGHRMDGFFHLTPEQESEIISSIREEE